MPSSDCVTIVSLRSRGGLPRSQPRKSVAPRGWQVLQLTLPTTPAASRELSASYQIWRPRLTAADAGSAPSSKVLNGVALELKNSPEMLYWKILFKPQAYTKIEAPSGESRTPRGIEPSRSSMLRRVVPFEES